MWRDAYEHGVSNTVRPVGTHEYALSDAVRSFDAHQHAVRDRARRADAVGFAYGHVHAFPDGHDHADDVAVGYIHKPADCPTDGHQHASADSHADAVSATDVDDRSIPDPARLGDGYASALSDRLGNFHGVPDAGPGYGGAARQRQL